MPMRKRSADTDWSTSRPGQLVTENLLQLRHFLQALRTPGFLIYLRGYAALLARFKLADVYYTQFAARGATVAIYNGFRILFIFYLFWIVYVIGTLALGWTTGLSGLRTIEGLVLGFFAGAGVWHIYTGLAVHLRYNVMRWHPNTRGFGFQADIICLLLDQGFTYKEIPVRTIGRKKGDSKALTFKNLLSVFHTLVDIIVCRIRTSRIALADRADRPSPPALCGLRGLVFSRSPIAHGARRA